MPVHDWSKVPNDLFRAFQTLWIAQITLTLNKGGLPPGYEARPEQDVGAGVADVLTLRFAGAGPAGPAGTAPAATRRPATRFSGEQSAPRIRPRPKYIKIRRADDDELVAVIEVVSPGNKNNRNGLSAFVRKARALINNGLNLLVIDLIPPGRRDPEGLHPLIWGEDAAFALPPDKRLTLASYVGGEVQRYFADVVAPGDAMSDVPLFLIDEDYIQVPIQHAYDEAFNSLGPRDRDTLTKTVPTEGL